MLAASEQTVVVFLRLVFSHVFVKITLPRVFGGTMPDDTHCRQTEAACSHQEVAMTRIRNSRMLYSEV